MSSIPAKVRNNAFGYSSLILIIFMIIKSQTLVFFVFWLFLFLVTDVIVNGIHNKIPSISKLFLLNIFYVILISIALLISIRVVPEFVSDLPKYSKQIETELTKFIAGVSAKYSVPIDFSAAESKMLTDATKSISNFVVIFKGISKGFLYFIFALVLNFLFFNDKNAIKEIFSKKENSLLSYLYNFLIIRLKKFYYYFKTVMGGQVIISLINTFITAILVFAFDMPHKISLITLIFICGLLPVIGNVISNTILTVTAFFTNPNPVMAFSVCLIVLMIIHKLEYFLNSKIIGSIVKLPMFITLLALLVGESLLGILGIVLAIPTILFLKSELEEINSN